MKKLFFVALVMFLSFFAFADGVKIWEGETRYTCLANYSDGKLWKGETRYTCLANYSDGKIWKGETRYTCLANYSNGKIWKGETQYKCLFNFSNDDLSVPVMMFLVYYYIYYRGEFE